MPSNKPHTVYKLKNGQRVPSVTTYLGILDKPAIVHWAWKCGMDGRDYKVVRDQSADIGTLVHALICNHLLGQEAETAEYSAIDIEVAEGLFGIYLSWEKHHVISPKLVETPLVSEHFEFGGTMDFYGVLDGKQALMDFKTTGAIYPEHFHQLAAYAQLVVESGEPAPEVIKVLRIGKDCNGVEEQDLPLARLDDHWRIFQACQRIYNIRRDLNRKHE